MPTCEVCGDHDDFPYSCAYCNQSYCSTHHLPENHDCPTLDTAQTLGPEFRAWYTDTRRHADSKVGSRPEPMELTDEHRMGSRGPEPEYAPSPDTELESDPDTNSTTGWAKTALVTRLPYLLLLLGLLVLVIILMK